MTCLGLTCFGQCRFRPTEGGEPNSEGWRPRRVGPRKVWPRRVGPRRVGGPKFRVFSPLPPQFAFFLVSLECLFVEFWWCLRRRGAQMYNGTRDAASIWRDTRSEILKDGSMNVGTACPAFFCSHDGDIKGLCHGDDFCVVARRKQLQIFGKV